MALMATFGMLILTGVVLLFAVSLEVGFAFLAPIVTMLVAANVFPKMFADTPPRPQECVTETSRVLDLSTFDGKLRSAGNEDRTE